MQPSPIAETSRLLFPSFRFCIVSLFNRSTNVILSEAKNLGSFVHRVPGSKDSDVMLAAKVQHLLRFGDATDHRAGETAAAANETERGDAQRLRGSADKRKIS